MAAGADTDGPVSVDIDIDDGETRITVSGEKDAAVVVRSASGEQIYLPPEKPKEQEATPYQPAGHGDSPYDGLTSGGPYTGISDSPYGSARQQPAEVGLTATSGGFRIRHPEPATDVRVIRRGR